MWYLTLVDGTLSCDLEISHVINCLTIVPTLEADIVSWRISHLIQARIHTEKNYSVISESNRLIVSNIAVIYLINLRIFNVLLTRLKHCALQPATAAQSCSFDELSDITTCSKMLAVKHTCIRNIL